TRRSMQLRRSVDRGFMGGHSRNSSAFTLYNGLGDREGLMRGYDNESQIGLHELVDEEESNHGGRNSSSRPSPTALNLDGVGNTSSPRDSYDVPSTSSPTVGVSPLTRKDSKGSSHRRSRTSSVHFKVPTTPKIDEAIDERDER
ncbi:hypothetical protein KEM55_004895, partial [Ascosphaera atra]